LPLLLALKNRLLGVENIYITIGAVAARKFLQFDLANLANIIF